MKLSAIATIATLFVSTTTSTVNAACIKALDKLFLQSYNANQIWITSPTVGQNAVSNLFTDTSKFDEAQ